MSEVAAIVPVFISLHVNVKGFANAGGTAIR
jgi:hypothetical protein